MSLIHSWRKHLAYYLCYVTHSYLIALMSFIFRNVTGTSKWTFVTLGSSCRVSVIWSGSVASSGDFWQWTTTVFVAISKVPRLLTKVKHLLRDLNSLLTKVRHLIRDLDSLLTKVRCLIRGLNSLLTKVRCLI